jgi:hypothetical protein
LFFGDAVDIDIHEESKNKLTTKFAAKGRICDSVFRSLSNIPRTRACSCVKKLAKALDI